MENYSVVNFHGMEVYQGTQEECIGYATWEFSSQITSTLHVIDAEGKTVMTNMNGHIYWQEEEESV